MSHFRLVPMAFALAAASTLIACNTAPAMPMGAAPATGMAAMDGQMKTMRDMHTKMTNAKTPEERQALMDEHMKAMQGGMGMMKGMSGMGGMSGMSGMGGMSDSKAMPADMAQRQKMMTQHMAMMQMMMDMMSQRMPPASGKQ